MSKAYQIIHPGHGPERATLVKLVGRRWQYKFGYLKISAGDTLITIAVFTSPHSFDSLIASSWITSGIVPMHSELSWPQDWKEIES